MHIRLTPYKMTILTLLIAIALFTWAIALHQVTMSKTEKTDGATLSSDETITTYTERSTYEQNNTKQDDMKEPVKYTNP
ncbi:MAG: hypothetical protein QCH96_05290 [Candidatus Thermoplasmatota archaeon]|nr:hypothetical protein [Candidatus Thermoplasmatota archaeon]